MKVICSYKEFDICIEDGSKEYVIYEYGERISALHLGTVRAAKNVIDTHVSNVEYGEYKLPWIDKKENKQHLFKGK